MKQIVKRIPKAIKKVATGRSNKRSIKSFADENGLVYFGFVSQADDEHKLIRGITMSTDHRDDHYSVGTYKQYDVSFVERSDSIKNTRSGHRKAHVWHIFEFDLKVPHDYPHVFVGLHTHSEEFYGQLFTRFPVFRELQLGHLSIYPEEFTRNYRIYSNPKNILEIERLIKPESAELIAKHFGSLSFEIVGGTLYIYNESGRLTEQLLTTMIQNGRWLAETIDQAAAALKDNTRD